MNIRLSGLLLAFLLPAAALRAASEETLKTFDRCWSTVQKRFYDRDLHGVDWEAVRDRYRARAADAEPGDELHDLLREMLGELNASHTTILEADVYKMMMAELGNKPGPNCGVTLAADERGRLFVRTLYEGGPGEQAGLLRGDEVLSIDGQDPVQSGQLVDAGFDPGFGGGPLYFLRPDLERSLWLEVQSGRDGDGLRVVPVRALRMNGVDAARNSVRVIERSGVRVGTLHVWFCSRGVTRVVKDALRGPLKDCDALVLDLRGRGGLLDVALGILDLFEAGRDVGHQTSREEVLWRKPVVFLIDGRSRSAKEIMAYWIRRRALGRLVGESTEGAVLAAGFYPMPDGSWLELAVMDVPVEPGVRLEGVGVAPDDEVESFLPYSRGLDLIHETGCHVAVMQVLANR